MVRPGAIGGPASDNGDRSQIAASGARKRRERLRLAEALKANLIRRKEQKRERQTLAVAAAGSEPPRSESAGSAAGRE